MVHCPQLPASSVVIVEQQNNIQSDGMDHNSCQYGHFASLLYLEDPKPKFLYINENNICVLTLQENNGIALTDLVTASSVASLQQVW